MNPNPNTHEITASQRSAPPAGSARVVQDWLWAPIIKPKRGAEWVCWTCIRTTRREAKREFLKDLPERLHKERLKSVRFARVSVSEMFPQNAAPTRPAQPHRVDSQPQT